MSSVSDLIWISCRPLIRLVFCVSCGFILTKADVFPTVAARGASQIVLNITLPCLMFSKIVPAFNANNVGTLGPLVLIALLYQAIGGVLAWIIKQFFWVPHQFRYGILVAGAWGNIPDIPTSVIMSVTGAAPFNGPSDQGLGVAYISVFLLVFLVTLFPLGGHQCVAMDYVGPDIEPEEVRETMRLKHMALFRFFFRQKNKFSDEEHKKPDQSIDTSDEKSITSTITPTEEGLPTLKKFATQGSLNSFERTNTMTTTTDVDDDSKKVPGLPQTQHTLPMHYTFSSHTSTPSHHNKSLLLLCDFLKTYVTPPSVAFLISFPIALIPQLKALFTEVPGTFIPPAPDGQPPLAFILDATTFMGAASSPLGLICLGSALARLHLPKRGEWRTMPLGAIWSLAVARMLVMPVLGVLICESLTHVGVISRDDKVLRFVCILISCLPTATTQVFLTQVYSGTGTAQHLSTFLIPQYILMFISMTTLITYSLHLIF